MLGKYLKEIRTALAEKDPSGKYSSRAVAERWGKAASYLSDIENEKIEHPKDDAIIDLFVKGYDYKYSEAKKILSTIKVQIAFQGLNAEMKSEVINSIVAGDDSIVIIGGISGGNNSIGNRDSK